MTTAWDGSYGEFWFAVSRTRAGLDTESEAAVLSEIADIAVLAVRRDKALRELVAMWRDAARSVNQPDSPSIFVACAEELEQLLD